jgi:peptidoglycan/LPS O-acetylase OafA/YrhL
MADPPEFSSVRLGLSVEKLAKPMKYRREIDGLRALAVVPVILFHAGFRAFSGGYVGVDIFFVISGYLITSLILTEQRAGTFTIVNFYERRARRILPALFIVLLACLPVAWLWLYPRELEMFSHSLTAVSTFSSNLYFWKTSSYFDTSSELKPLLHTWSLAVEEQYYLVFPVFLILTKKLDKRWILVILGAIAALSLLAAQWGTVNAPTFSFYVLPTRAWELLIGVFIAFYFERAKPVKHGRVLGECGGFAGLLLIAYAVSFFDAQTPSPGLFTLLPTLGAGLIILFATPQTVAGRLLGNKVLVGVGLISYSAYLWHNPLFAFARLLSPDQPRILCFALLSAVSLVLAFLSWKFVETPFRKMDKIDRNAIALFSVTGLLCFVGAGLVQPYLRSGFPFSPEQRKIYAYTSYEHDFSYKSRENICFLSPVQSYEDFAPECKHVDTTMPTVMLWGDSHAAMLSVGLRFVYGDVIQYTAAGCPPIAGRRFLNAKYCAGINDFVLGEVGRIRPNQIIMDASWLVYGNRIDDVAETIDKIRIASPTSRIVVVGTVPLWPGGLPALLLRRGYHLDNTLYIHPPTYAALLLNDQKLKTITHAKNVGFVSALDTFCESDKCEAVTMLNGTPALTSFDSGHLTDAGSIQLAQEVRRTTRPAGR